MATIDSKEERQLSQNAVAGLVIGLAAFIAGIILHLLRGGQPGLSLLIVGWFITLLSFPFVLSEEGRKRALIFLNVPFGVFSLDAKSVQNLVYPFRIVFCIIGAALMILYPLLALFVMVNPTDTWFWHIGPLQLFFVGATIVICNLLLSLDVKKAVIVINVVFMMVFAFIILVAVNYVNVRHFKRYDWTQGASRQLSSQTVSIISNLDDKHHVVITTLFAPMDQLSAVTFGSLKDLLEEYRFDSSNIEVHHVDPLSDRIAMLRLKDQLKGPLQLNSVLVQCGANNKQVSLNDLIEQPSNPNQNPYMAQEPPKFKGEDAITAAIISVTQEKQSTICFTTGHGERDYDDYDKETGLSQFATALRRDNYKLDKVNLSLKKEVPSDCDLLVIAGPTKDFQPSELAALGVYLSKNGKLLIMLEPKIAGGGACGLDPLLAEYSVKANPDLMVVNKVRDMFTGEETISDQIIVAADAGYPPSKITDKIRTENTVLPGACPVDSAMPEPEGAPPGAPPAGPYRVTSLCKSAEGASWGITDLKKVDEKNSVKGPFSLAVSVEPKGTQQPNPYGGPPMTNPNEKVEGPRLVVFGSAHFAMNAFIRAYGNQDLLMNVVSWLAVKEAQMGIAAKPFEDRPIALTPVAAKVIFLFSVLLMPIFGAVSGIAVWVMRQKLVPGKLSKGFYLGFISVTLGLAVIFQALANVLGVMGAIAPETAKMLAMIAAVPALLGAAGLFVLCYKAWESIQDGNAGTTPGKVGALLACTILSVLCIFFAWWVPYAGALVAAANYAVTVALISNICSAVNQFSEASR